jgi:hypothetical protein
LSDALEQAGIPREVTVSVIYKGKTLPLGFRADILVGNTILVEIKAVVALLSQIPVGLLMNFHAIGLKDGLRRFVI